MQQTYLILCFLVALVPFIDAIDHRLNKAEHRKADDEKPEDESQSHYSQEVQVSLDSYDNNIEFLKILCDFFYF